MVRGAGWLALLLILIASTQSRCQADSAVVCEHLDRKRRRQRTTSKGRKCSCGPCDYRGGDAKKIEYSALEKQVETRLNEQGLKSVECGGGGNCFFHAVAYAINSVRPTNIDYRDVRDAVVAYARNHPDDPQYEAWHVEGTFVDNVNKLARDNVWIESDVEILTVVALYGVSIQLIKHDCDIHFNPPNTNVQDQITLAYYDQAHYRGTRTIEEPRDRSNSLASQSTNCNDREVRSVD